MSKKKTNSKSTKKKKPNKQQTIKAKNKSSKSKVGQLTNRKEGYCVSMSHCISIDQDYSKAQMIPAILFAAIVIFIVRLYRFYRDMTQFFWSNNDPGTPAEPKLVDFFSYYKSNLIIIIAVLVILILLFRVMTQSFAIKKTSFYIPMIIYFVFTFLSFIFSDYKEFAWRGWNERFEGTIILFCYMIMLFFIINTVNTERSIKWILYPITGASIVLSLIGLSQAFDKDFFKTEIGQKIIVPNEMTPLGQTTHQLIEEAAKNGDQYLAFTFQNNQIYQTVYNINYVSFYLTLLVPLFSILFLREQHVGKKIFWGITSLLTFFNLFGSASSGGLMGSGIVLVITIVILNKRIIKWKWSMLILVVIIILSGISSYYVAKEFNGIKWTDEFTNAIKSATTSNSSSQEPDSATPPPLDSSTTTSLEEEKNTPKTLDSLVTKKDTLYFEISGEAAEMQFVADGSIIVTDASGNELVSTDGFPIEPVELKDERFYGVSFIPMQNDQEMQLIGLNVANTGMTWPFALTGKNNSELKYYNGIGKFVTLNVVPHVGFKNNPNFGSGRGYIWSASLPLIKNSLIIGSGADTFPLVFPHNDYLEKIKSVFSQDMIIDKPHNMYLGVAINTGMISLLALLALFGIYLVQSAKLYWREKEYNSISSIAGLGIALGITSFLIAGIVNDSSVSVMPLFYSLLGTGIATNIIVKRSREKTIDNNK